MLRRRFLAAGSAVALSAAGFALAGETSAWPGETTAGITLTDITSVTTNVTTDLTTDVTTDVTTNVPTTVLTATRAAKRKPPPRKRGKRTVATSTSTAATTASPPATTQGARTTARVPRRGTTIAAADTGSSSLPGWAIVGFVLGGVLIAAGLGGLYATRIRRR